MGFSFFSFGRKGKAAQAQAPDAQPGKHTLGAADVGKWLESEFSGSIVDERKNFSEISSGMLSHVSTFRKDVEAVRDKKFGKGESYYAAVNMIKDTWARKTLIGISSYQSKFREVPKDADFTFFGSLYSDTLRLVNDACVLPKQQVVLKQFFEDESRRLAETLRSLGQSMDSLGELVRGSSALKAQAGVSSLLAELSEAQASAASMKSGTSSISVEMEKKTGEISALEKHLAAISSDPAWKEIERIEKNREAGIREREGIETDISARMGGLKRPLKLFAHEAGGLGKEEIAMAESLSHSPVKMILSSDAQAVEKLLSKALLGGRKMKLPEKDASKLEAIESMISTGWVRKASGRYATLSKRIEEDWNSMKAIDIASKKVHAGRLLEQSGMELEALGKQKETLEAKISQEEKNIAQKKKEISDLIRKELSREVEVK